MTDQLNQDVRKAVDEVLKERDEMAMRQETEEALSKSADKINELVASLEAKDGEIVALGSKIEELESTVAELSCKIKELETQKEDLDKEKAGFQTEKEDLLKQLAESEASLENIRRDQLAASRLEDLKNNGVAALDPEASKAQVAKIREMSDEDFETYKNDRVELRKDIVAELERSSDVVSPTPATDDGSEPVSVEANADSAVIETPSDADIAASVEDSMNAMSAVAAALNLEVVPTQDDKAKYGKLGEELAKRIKDKKAKRQQ